MTMLTTFSPSLVVTSILVAMFASYVALTLAQSVTRASGRARAAWLAAGAFAMGIGIWSMHFIGMLAFEMPGMAMAYDVPSMVLSIVVAVGASALAFYLTSLPAVPPGSIVSGGVAMATAIAGMHYIGMNSMRMAASIRWNTYLVVASMVIALVASVGALVILNRLRNKADHWKEMLLAAIVMGLAVSGMHYTGMIAATFVHKPHTAIEPSHLLVSLGLELAVITTTLMILVLALGSALVQKLLAKRNAETKAILGKNEECFRKLVEAVKDYAILMVDPEGRITTWNAGAERIMGYTEEQAIGQHLTIFVPADHVPEVSRELELARTLGHFQGESPHTGALPGRKPARSPRRHDLLGEHRHLAAL
jgi:NO-binding membrane sensor protein with MHYT domain